MEVYSYGLPMKITIGLSNQQVKYSSVSVGLILQRRIKQNRWNRSSDFVPFGIETIIFSGDQNILHCAL